MMKIVSIAVSRKKGTRKTRVESAELIADHGLSTDAHAGRWHRQVSFLAAESIAGARGRGLTVDFGDFAENIATTGIDWPRVPIGTRLRLGRTAVVEITQIGKECHNKCAIYYQAGDCIMPREGVFARVLTGGVIRIGEAIEYVETPVDAAETSGDKTA
ncbi:MAG: MOSC domain-containing protein [Desulfobacterales bacterium]